MGFIHLERKKKSPLAKAVRRKYKKRTSVLIMTKDEAIKEMQAGKKITHPYFASYEWMTIDKGSLLFEDGVRCSISEFFSLRTSEQFNKDYSLFNEAEDPMNDHRIDTVASTRPLEKPLIFSYTTEELFLLQDIYLSELNDSIKDEFYDTEKGLAEGPVNSFVDWLMEEDRRKLL
jgi:hypothetical protein